jgi:hypothetical protein
MKRTAAQRAIDLDKLGDLFCAGASQAEMAQQLSLSQPQVSKDLRKLDERWKASLGSFEVHRGRELAKINAIEREFRKGWDRSKEDKEVTTSEKSTGGGENGERTKAAKRVEGQAGNPAFLSGVLECIRERINLLRPVQRRLTLDTLGELLDALPYDVAIELRAILGGHARIERREESPDAAGGLAPSA